MSQDRYQDVARLIRYLHTHLQEQPSLQALAAEVNLSESHLQRLFSEWAGVSPKRFLQYLTKEHAKQALRQNCTALDTALDSGLSGPGRLHDLMISCEAMTPGEIRAQGLGMMIRYGYAVSPFGAVLLGWTERGICYLAFYDGDPAPYETELMQEWPNADFSRCDASAAQWVERIFITPNLDKPLYLLLKGTNFQLKVWEALLRVGSGERVSYSQLAQLAGSPKASRAVGSAMAANRIGFLIPCHRVIRETGEVGHYRWGSVRKAALQGWESSRQTCEQV